MYIYIFMYHYHMNVLPDIFNDRLRTNASYHLYFTCQDTDFHQFLPKTTPCFYISMNDCICIFMVKINGIELNWSTVQSQTLPEDRGSTSAKYHVAQNQSKLTT